MKKALSMILALTMSAAVAVPACAAEYPDYYPGYFSEDSSVDYDVDNPAVIGPGQGVDWYLYATDAAAVFTPVIPASMLAEDIYYEVQPGDTLEAIAFAYYGRSDLASALRQYNKNGHFLQSGGILEAYRALRIPATLNNVARAENPLPVLSTWAEPLQLNDGTILYRVKAGDTLKKIAATFYNGRSDSFIVNEIVKANAGIKNANVIYQGMIIQLPLVVVGL